MAKNNRADFAWVSLVFAKDLFPLNNSLFEQLIHITRHEFLDIQRLLPQYKKPPPKQGQVLGEPAFDFIADLALIHLKCKGAIVSYHHRRFRVLVREPAEPAGCPDSIIRGSDLDIVALREESLRGLPNSLVGVDQAQNCAVARDRGMASLSQ